MNIVSAEGNSRVKTLHLLRHAKSSWDEPGLADRERGLNRRGARDAPRMGRALAAMLPAMRLHVSSARRARLTLEGLCAGWPEIAGRAHAIDEDLYTFSAGDLRQWLALRDDEPSALFLIGHNPALTDLVNQLAGRGALANLPTAGYVQLALGVDHWSQLVQGCGTVVTCLFPRQLPRD
ncbi:MAG: histidine phosphatase family protein [Halioglobus sp.]